MAQETVGLDPFRSHTLAVHWVGGKDHLKNEEKNLLFLSFLCFYKIIPAHTHWKKQVTFFMLLFCFLSVPFN